MVVDTRFIAEMDTGEGKTLVATLAVYLNALEGKGVHVVTVNDYLAKRDAEWMGKIYNALGLSVGVIVAGMDDRARQQAYACDVTYGTNNEFGFDYLRDNMKFRLEDMVQRPFNFAIVDEVDSILIDEARTPLIISGPAQDSSEMYRAVDKLIPKLNEEDYEKDEKMRTVALTDAGTEHAEQLLSEMGLLEEGGLYDFQNVNLVHHVNQALRAHKLFNRDDHYIVKNDKVIIIDEFTGRMMEGRRFSEGLHQALEAKEGVSVQQENQTLASITFQNYFRLYPKLSGMTGTALTEAAEFQEIYNLGVLAIPTNLPVARVDEDDEVYRTAQEKYDAIVALIEECRERQQPVLVGTTTIEKSELLAAALKKAKIPHQVLNARFHEQEATIIAQAGKPGAVTIATNMAGRGTDIKLGGNVDMRLADELDGVEDQEKRAQKAAEIKQEVAAAAEIVKQAGGLFVLGTERHESRRIDNQLRGRSGRQGDPGASRFFLSLQDDLMRIFGSDRMDGMLQRLGLQEGEAIVHPWINKAIERAQKKVEQQHFEVRKNLLKFDNVMNDQRKVIYEQRRELMATDDVSEDIKEMRHEVVQGLVSRCIPPNSFPEQWDLDSLNTECHRLFNLDLPVHDWAAEDGIAEEEIARRITEAADNYTAKRAAEFGPDIMRQLERAVLLQLLDHAWKDHLLSMDHLRQGINLRAYAQRDPLNEYKREAFEMFETMLAQLREQVTATISHVQLEAAAPEELMPQGTPPSAYQETREDPALSAEAQASGPDLPGEPAVSQPVRRQPAAQIDPNDPGTWGKVQRNAPCPCGSGKKYKHCHGRVTAEAAE